MRYKARWFAGAVVAAMFLLCGSLRSQEPAIIAAPGAAAVNEPDSDRSLREQSIYIPYENLRRTFEREGRGVFLPYAKFRELWDAARAAQGGPGDGPSRRVAMITEIESEASVTNDLVEVRATLKFETSGQGWHEIPLRLADAAITEAQIDGQPARLVADAGQGYRLLVENPDDKPHRSALNLVYAKGITRAPGQNSVAFQAPQAPVNRWKVRIPEGGVKVDIQPMIAVTEAAEETPGAAAKGAAPQETGPKTREKPPAQETVILAFVGAAPEVRIAWTPKAEGATGLAALASVQAEQQVFVGEGVTRTRTQMVYTISRAELGQLAITVPADQKVVNVFDANVRQWTVAEEGPRQKITVQLFEPAKGSQVVIVELERFHAGSAAPKAPADPKAEVGPTWPTTLELAVPVVEAADVGRQQGLVVVQVGEGLRAEANRKVGLVQVDAGELPAELAKTPWGFSYRYVSVPYELVLAVEKIEPRVTADSLVEASLEPTRLALAVTTVYQVERVGVFRLELEVPEGFAVRAVEGRQVGEAVAAQIDSHHQTGEKKDRLVVNLAKKAIGGVGLMIFLDRRLEHPELQTPMGKAVTIPIPVPLVPAATVERASGRLVVYSPESLRVNPVGPTALRSVSPDEALAGMASTRGGARGVLAYVFGEQAPLLSVEAERRKPQVTVAQLLVARIEDGVTRYELSLLYDVLYSGVRSLRIDVPEDLAALLHIKSKGFREQVIDPAPDDLAKGCVAWSLTGGTELIGSGRIDLAWENKMEKLEAGSSVSIDIPWIRPMEVDRAWGQIVLTKAETIDLSESDKISGLRPIDPQRDLIGGVKVEGAVQAYEFREDWQFQVTATRYDLEDIKQTSIPKSLLRMVVMRSGKTSVQALYRIRSADQRLELQMPEGSEFDADPRIDGRSVTMETGKDRTYFIPLLGTREEQSFLLELRYTLSDPDLPTAWPVFPTQPAIQKVYLCLYLPEEINLLVTRGPWTREFRWGLNGMGVFEPLNAMVVGDDTVGTWPAGLVEARSMPAGQRNDAVSGRLLGWVAESAALPETFATDGQLFVFSALRPESPASDGLRLYCLHRGYVETTAVIVTLVLGLLLLPMGFRRRVFVLGILAVGLVFAAIYRPLAVWNVCDMTLVLPLLIVAVIWFVHLVAWRLPNRLRSRLPLNRSSDPAARGEAASNRRDGEPAIVAEPVHPTETDGTSEGERSNG
ncbi:MAG: hypothetical protein ACYC6Y_03490 [Thermoguttaceae bacterium]